MLGLVFTGQKSRQLVGALACRWLEGAGLTRAGGRGRRGGWFFNSLNVRSSWFVGNFAVDLFGPGQRWGGRLRRRSFAAKEEGRHKSHNADSQCQPDFHVALHGHHCLPQYAAIQRRDSLFRFLELGIGPGRTLRTDVEGRLEQNVASAVIFCRMAAD
jgi:hypothetical protein